MGRKRSADTQEICESEISDLVSEKSTYLLNCPPAENQQQQEWMIEALNEFEKAPCNFRNLFLAFTMNNCQRHEKSLMISELNEDRRLDIIGLLPEEISVKILLHLTDIDAMLSYRLISKKWNIVVSNSKIWHKLMKSTFNKHQFLAPISYWSPQKAVRSLELQSNCKDDIFPIDDINGNRKDVEIFALWENFVLALDLKCNLILYDIKNCYQIMSKNLADEFDSAQDNPNFSQIASKIAAMYLYMRKIVMNSEYAFCYDKNMHNIHLVKWRRLEYVYSIPMTKIDKSNFEYELSANEEYLAAWFLSTKLFVLCLKSRETFEIDIKSNSRIVELSTSQVSSSKVFWDDFNCHTIYIVFTIEAANMRFNEIHEWNLETREFVRVMYRDEWSNERGFLEVVPKHGMIYSWVDTKLNKFKLETGEKIGNEIVFELSSRTISNRTFTSNGEHIVIQQCLKLVIFDMISEKNHQFKLISNLANLMANERFIVWCDNRSLKFIDILKKNR